MIASLPVGFQARHPRDEDAQAIADLMNAFSAAFGDVADADAESVRQDWEHPRLNRDTDTLLVTDGAGRIVGYESVWRGSDAAEVELDGYVHPDVLARGIGTELVRWGEIRAHELTADLAPDTLVTVRLGSMAVDGGATRLFTDEGYHVIRHFWRMQIELDTPPLTPVIPDGIIIRAFVPGQDDHATYETVEESFADHWSHTPVPFEEWRATKIGAEGFDPSLWFLAVDGDQVAGITLGRMRGPSGWVGTVGVRRPWRRRGLAMALLLTAFRAYYERGIRTVGLGVDAQSLTGATRVYERAGMFIRTRYDLYQKEMRQADLAVTRQTTLLEQAARGI